MVSILAELSVDLSRYHHALDVLDTLLRRLRIDLALFLIFTRHGFVCSF